MKQVMTILTLFSLAACEPMAPGAALSSQSDPLPRSQIGGSTPSGPGITIQGDAYVGVVTRL